MAQYSNAEFAGRGRGVLFGSTEGISPRLTDPQKALYLSAIGLLRAQHASSVSLLHRIGYVKDTIAMLDQAKQLSGRTSLRCELDCRRCHAELPGFFRQRKAAAGRVSLVPGER